MEIGKADFSAYNYQSPIETLFFDMSQDVKRKLEAEMDENLVVYVQKYGFNVNAEELKKALAYDRNQYEKGYVDGRRARDSEIVRCKDCKYNPSKDEWIHCNRVTWWNRPDDYCSRGERKEVEDELS